MGSIFKFKQFAVDQADCAMKINTDGVLLGAQVDINDCTRILDIGTGTGVIAMMLAQRQPQAYIDAVDIDSSAADRATSNFEESPFSERLRAFHCSFDELDKAKQYDLMVSNPPFFMNSLKNPDARKTIARHTDYSFFDKLITFASIQLVEEGRLSVIVPVDVSDYMVEVAKQFGLCRVNTVEIRSFADTEVIRHILTLQKTKRNLLDSIHGFIIYKDRGIYSDAYKSILQPFFLAF